MEMLFALVHQDIFYKNVFSSKIQNYPKLEASQTPFKTTGVKYIELHLLNKMLQSNIKGKLQLLSTTWKSHKVEQKRPDSLPLPSQEYYI